MLRADTAAAVTGLFMRVAASGSAERTERALAVEAPIAIEINGIGYAVMMATPFDLDDFAVGFALSERLIESAEEILAIDTYAAGGGHVLRITVPAERSVLALECARRRMSESSCGLCGIESVEQVLAPLPHVEATLDVADAAIFRALGALSQGQPLNRATGGVHAAAFCRPDGTVVLVREDVGRHNALDKLIGALQRQRIAPTSGFLLVTARCSFELVQKAVLANCPLLVSISVATSLAVERAKAHGLALVTLARPDALLRLA